MSTESTKKPRKKRSLSEAKTHLQDRISAARIFKPTSAEFNETVTKMRQWFTLRQYEWQYLQGWFDGLRHEMEMKQHRFAYIINGELVPANWDKMTEEQREWCRQGKNDDGGHFWLNRDHTLGRCYFASAKVSSAPNGFVNITDAVNEKLKSGEIKAPTTPYPDKFPSRELALRGAVEHAIRIGEAWMKDAAPSPEHATLDNADWAAANSFVQAMKHALNTH